MEGRGRWGRLLARFLLASTPPGGKFPLTTIHVSANKTGDNPELLETEDLIVVNYSNLFHNIPINNGVRVDGVGEDVCTVTDHKLTGGLQVVLSRVSEK